MGINRRQYERIPVSIGIVLDFSTGTREARISDLSLGGCFVDSIAKVVGGEFLSLKLTVAGKTFRLQGEIVYVYPNVGFGLRFTDLTENDRVLLEELFIANGGKPSPHSVPAAEKEIVAEEKPPELQAAAADMELTPFEILQKSIQDALKPPK
jgi:hypothetical protein